jgi:hypothetical protein
MIGIRHHVRDVCERFEGSLVTKLYAMQSYFLKKCHYAKLLK